MRFCRRSPVRKRSAFLRISSSDIFVPFTPWFCQTLLTSFGGSSFAMAPSFVKPASQDALDAMNLGRDVSSGYPCDLCNRGSVHAFQIRHDHLPVERFKPLDQRQEPVQSLALV